LRGGKGGTLMMGSGLHLDSLRHCYKSVFFKSNVINFVGCSFLKQPSSENNSHWTVTIQELFISQRIVRQ